MFEQRNGLTKPLWLALQPAYSVPRMVSLCRVLCVPSHCPLAGLCYIELSCIGHVTNIYKIASSAILESQYLEVVKRLKYFPEFVFSFRL